MRRPVILVDGHVLDGKPEGSSSYIAGLYSALADTGTVALKIATYEAESLMKWQLQAPSIDWVPLATQSSYRRLVFDMTRLQARIAPDYAHFQYITPVVKRCMWINTVHDLLFLDHPQLFPIGYRLKRRALFWLSALRSDVLLTVSNYSRDAINRHFGIDKARIHVTRNAIDRFVGAPDSPVEGLVPGRFLVYVSRFEPRKNQHRLVRAFIDLRAELSDDFRLVLVGYLALAYPELEAILLEAGERVVVASSLSHARLTWLYRNAACAIYPSLAEGFGMPAIEAVGAGGLSYCADNTGMSELAPYVHGTFDATSSREIRDAILRAADGRDVGLRAEVQSRAVAEFCWRASAESFLRAIRV